MAQAGFCSGCGGNVWLNTDGTCAKGHPASCVSGTYEVASPEPIRVGPPKKDRNGLLIGIVVGVIVLFSLCGVLTAIAVPVFLNASSDAAEKSCWANERVVEGVAQLYLAENEGATLPSDWDGLMSVLAGPELKKPPVCPSGGAYSVTGAGAGFRVSCSVHGQAHDSSTP